MCCRRGPTTVASVLGTEPPSRHGFRPSRGASAGTEGRTGTDVSRDPHTRVYARAWGALRFLCPCPSLCSAAKSRRLEKSSFFAPGFRDRDFAVVRPCLGLALPPAFAVRFQGQTADPSGPVGFQVADGLVGAIFDGVVKLGKAHHELAVAGSPSVVVEPQHARLFPRGRDAVAARL